MESDPLDLTLTPDVALTYLTGEANALLARPERTILGIAGGPGVGKSTMATRLVTLLNERSPNLAAYVPMDGFHMVHSKLEALGTVADKGMPHTFEGEAFAHYLATLKSATMPISGPLYSRQNEDIVPDAFTVPAATRLLVVEGNYLLLASSPWWPVRPLLDRAIFLDVSRDLVRTRLLKRHAEAGLFTEERNRAHVERVDLTNYDLVMRNRSRADVAIRLQTAS